jgi:hypothetical protein
MSSRYLAHMIITALQRPRHLESPEPHRRRECPPAPRRNRFMSDVSDVQDRQRSRSRDDTTESDEAVDEELFSTLIKQEVVSDDEVEEVFHPASFKCVLFMDDEVTPKEVLVQWSDYPNRDDWTWEPVCKLMRIMGHRAFNDLLFPHESRSVSLREVECTCVECEVDCSTCGNVHIIGNCDGEYTS